MHRRMNPQTKFAWQHGGYPFSKHPFFKKHGHSLSGTAFDASKSNVARHWKGDDEDEGQFSWASSQPELMQKIITLLNNIQEAEEPHIAELEQAAIQISSEVWGIDPSRLRAKITSNVQPDPQPEMEEEEEDLDDQQEGEDEIEDEDEEDEAVFNADEIEMEDTDSPRHIDHRVLMNLLTQGAAVHQYNTLHHLAADKINQINPSLLKSYTQIATGITHTYWLLPILQMMQNAAAAQGSAVGSEQIQTDKEGNGIVVAKGNCFPVLLHELTKGIMELITYHQISKQDPVMQEKIVQGADKFDSEPWMIMVGPEVWKRFLKILQDNRIPNNRIAYIIHRLADAEPEEAAEFIDAVVSDPRKAASLLGKFNTEEEPENPVYGEEPEQYGNDDDDDAADAWKRGIRESKERNLQETADAVDQIAASWGSLGEDDHMKKVYKSDERQMRQVSKALREGNLRKAVSIAEDLDTILRDEIGRSGLWDLTEDPTMAPAPAAPTKPKPAPTAPPRPSRPAPGKDPFNPKMPGKGKPGVLPQPKFRDGDEEFGNDEMIDDISNAIGNEWDLPSGIGGEWDPIADDHPNGMNEGGSGADVGFETCAECGNEVPRSETICTVDGSFLCGGCAAR